MKELTWGEQILKTSRILLTTSRTSRILHTFKAINLLAPSYICDLVTLKKPSNYNLRSNNSLVPDPPKIKSLATLGDRSFSVTAPKLWNKLPDYIRTSASITIFKSRLKTYIFRVAFDLNLLCITLIFKFRNSELINFLLYYMYTLLVSIFYLYYQLVVISNQQYIVILHYRISIFILYTVTVQGYFL